jgi:hypothetical protein
MGSEANAILRELSPHKPDEAHARDSGDNPERPQCALRRLDDRGGRPLRGPRKGREHKPLDREKEPERREDKRHARSQRAGAAGAGTAPDGFWK